MNAFLLRFDAPMMSFGGTVTDNFGVTNLFPGRSLLAGLFANALGYDHADMERLTRLQSSIEFAVRCDRTGRELVDFHTVDLGQDFLTQGWTTYGAVQKRNGGVSDRTHIRYRHYLTDAIFTLAVKLQAGKGIPLNPEIAHALDRPARPLFLGRMCCAPATKIFLGWSVSSTLREGLEYTPLPIRAQLMPGNKLLARWPASETGGSAVMVTDDRDWFNQVHAGRREVREGLIAVRAPREKF